MYSWITFSILTLAVGFFLGYFFLLCFDADIKDEQYYKEKSAAIYITCLEYISAKTEKDKAYYLWRLKEKVKAYNSETKSIREWPYHCPKTFTLDYLLGNWNTDLEV